jgi:mono/diheme cytochrome c family protein
MRPEARGRLLFGLLALLAIASTPANAEYTPRTNYVLHCQGCHGADGVGGTPDEVPPLAGSVGWFLRVPGGRAYLAQVPGAANAPIDDAALAGVLNYVIATWSREEAGAAFAPYDAAEVAAVRRQQPDVVALRASLVEALWSRFGVELWGEGAAREDTSPRSPASITERVP